MRQKKETKREEREGKGERRGSRKKIRHFEDDICHAYLIYDCVDEVCEDCAAIHHFLKHLDYSGFIIRHQCLACCTVHSFAIPQHPSSFRKICRESWFETIESEYRSWHAMCALTTARQWRCIIQSLVLLLLCLYLTSTSIVVTNM